SGRVTVKSSAVSDPDPAKPAVAGCARGGRAWFRISFWNGGSGMGLYPISRLTWAYQAHHSRPFSDEPREGPHQGCSKNQHGQRNAECDACPHSKDCPWVRVLCPVQLPD